jgi:hypothetical protein
MKTRLTLALISIPFLAIGLSAGQQNRTVKTPQENTNTHEGIRSLLRQKDKRGAPRKVAKPKKRAPQKVSPVLRRNAIKPDYIDYPLLRQKDEKAPGEKNQ